MTDVEKSRASTRHIASASPVKKPEFSQMLYFLLECNEILKQFPVKMFVWQGRPI